jgi:hypothetical protein
VKPQKNKEELKCLLLSEKINLLGYILYVSNYVIFWKKEQNCNNNENTSGSKAGQALPGVQWGTMDKEAEHTEFSGQYTLLHATSNLQDVHHWVSLV